MYPDELEVLQDNEGGGGTAFSAGFSGSFLGKPPAHCSRSVTMGAAVKQAADAAPAAKAAAARSSTGPSDAGRAVGLSKPSNWFKRVLFRVTSGLSLK